MRLAIELYFVLHLFLGAPLDTLVTKRQGLPAWYSPGVNTEAKVALASMESAANDEGILFSVTSDFRDYAYQQRVNQREQGLNSDMYRSYSAAPGHSEHQLGTTFDLAWPGLRTTSLDKRNLELFAWLEENAHRYGFVISYPLKQTENWPYHNRWMPGPTEYIYEPWHVRYVGEALATTIWEHGYLDPASRTLPQDFYTPWLPNDF
jgi:D-alanyl-D-alanine carboxypeptidase